MTDRTAILIVFFLALTIGVSRAAEKVDLSGDWTMDRDKTELSDNQIYLAAIKVTHKGDSLFTARTYENEYREQYPFDENLTLDGKEYKITIYEMPRTTTANWTDDGNAVQIISKVLFYGDSGEVELEITEKWTLQEEGNLLCNDFTSKTPGDVRTGKLYYKKR